MKKILKYLFVVSLFFFIFVCVGSGIFIVKILKDKNSLIFDYSKLNITTTLSQMEIYDNNDNLKALIEFDGFYHFHSNNLEYGGVNVHNSTVEHDKRKTKYCIDNKIPLYRLCNEDTVHNELEEILKEI